MDTGLILLWGIVITTLIIIVIMSIIGILNWLNRTAVTIPNVSSICSPDYSTIKYDVSNLPCCIIGGQITSNKYIAEIDMIVSPTEVNPLQACAGFCVNGVDSDNKTCNNNVGQVQYSTCLSQLVPTNCIGISYPIAKSGLIYYYGFSATQDSCQNQGRCI